MYDSRRSSQFDKRKFLWLPSQPSHIHICNTNACNEGYCGYQANFLRSVIFHGFRNILFKHLLSIHSISRAYLKVSLHFRRGDTGMHDSNNIKCNMKNIEISLMEK